MELIYEWKFDPTNLTEGYRNKRTENGLGSGGSDDNLGAHRRNPNLHAGVTVLRQLTCQNLVQFGEEHSIRHKLHINNTIQFTVSLSNTIEKIK